MSRKLAAAALFRVAALLERAAHSVDSIAYRLEQPRYRVDVTHLEFTHEGLKELFGGFEHDFYGVRGDA